MILFFIILLAAILGSVANMLIYRLPRQLNIVSDRSKCTSCKHLLSALDLLPIISYIVLKGRCYHCRAKISIRYLLVELYCVCFAIFLWTTEFSFFAIKLSVFAYISLILFFTDLETKLLPLSLNGLLIVAGIAFNSYDYNMLKNALLGCFFGAAILLIIRFLTSWYYKVETMGLGDVILLAGVGAFWGVKMMLITIHSGVIFGGVLALALLIFKRVSKQENLAFGPFIIIGFWLSYFFGDMFVAWIYG